MQFSAKIFPNIRLELQPGIAPFLTCGKYSVQWAQWRSLSGCMNTCVYRCIHYNLCWDSKCEKDTKEIDRCKQLLIVTEVFFLLLKFYQHSNVYIFQSASVCDLLQPISPIWHEHLHRATKVKFFTRYFFPRNGWQNKNIKDSTFNYLSLLWLDGINLERWQL